MKRLLAPRRCVGVLAGGLVCLLWISGCKKAEPVLEQTSGPSPTTATTESSSGAAAAVSPSSADPSTNVDGVPSPADYESEAETKVTAGNLESELDKLEKEIATD